MADDTTSLLSRLNPKGVRSSVASLISSEDTDPDPRAYSRSGTEMYSTHVDIDRPDPKIENYVEEFRSNPIISTPIENLAYEVFEPGWWIEADSEETVDELTEFLHNVGIKAGMPHQSFTDLGKQAVIQNQVRGTFMGEKVTDDQGRHVAINPVNPLTFEIYKKPGTSMLLPADYDGASGSDTMVKENPDGETAAFVQFDEQFSRWDDREERRFTRDQMMHWPRWPDIGDVFGRSAIEPVYDRSIAMREKLDDNDLAISMKAWPMVLFQLGSEDHPWTEDEMQDFMHQYSDGELGPGMYQGVPGDVEVNEFAGETADIQEHVDTDIDLIVAGMPAPRYSLGTSAKSDTSGMNEAHERQFRKLVRAIRRDIENQFTPYLEDVAESWDYGTDGLELNIGRPDGEVAPEDVQGSIIRYQSDVSDGPDGSEEGGPSINPDDVGDDGGSESGPDGPSENGTVAEESLDETESDPIDVDHDQSGRLEYDTAALADPTFDAEPLVRSGDSVEELAQSELVQTRDLERDLGDSIAEALIDARDSTLDVVDARYGDNLPRGSVVASEFRSSVGSTIRRGDVSSEASDVLTEVVEATTDHLESEEHEPRISSTFTGLSHYSVRDGVQNDLLRDMENLASDMSTEIQRQFDEVNKASRGIATLRERVEDVYDDGTLEHRARLMARMRIQELINRTKLEQYRRHEDIVGVRIASRCGESTAMLTEELAACDGGNPPVALFDSEQGVGEQLGDAVTADPHEGFEPIVGVPPYGFGDTSEIAPVTDDELVDE